MTTYSHYKHNDITTFLSRYAYVVMSLCRYVVMSLVRAGKIDPSAGSQSEHTICFSLPARRTSHIVFTLDMESTLPINTGL